MTRLHPRAWPIRRRLTALNVAVLTATLALLGGTALLQLDRALISVTTDHLRDQARAMPGPDGRRPLGPPDGGRGAGGAADQREPSTAGRPQPDRPPFERPPQDRPPPDRGPANRRSDSPQPSGPSPSGPGDRPSAPPPLPLARVAADLVRRLAGPDTGVLVFDTGGTLIASSDWNEDVEAWPRPTAAQLAAVSSGAESSVVIEQRTRRTLVMLLPLRNPDGAIVGVVEQARSLELTDFLEARLRLVLLIGTLIALLVAGGLTLRATRDALGPLDAVVRAARAIEAGHLDERLRLQRRDEIGELAEAFDRMLDRLATLMAAQRRFVADAAHELRTPLTILSGMVEILQMGAHGGDPKAIRRIHDTMERELGRLGRLVSDLLTLSRLDADQPVRLELVPVAPLLTDVAQQTRLLAKGQDVQLRIDATPTVRGDPDRLKQVLLNLASNALAFTPTDGRIEFRLDQLNGDARLAVADSGAGIDAELLTRVMDRFARGDPSRTRATGGSGLGLAIARGIVEAHGGSIALASTVGQGTTATVELPVAG